MAFLLYSCKPPESPGSTNRPPHWEYIAAGENHTLAISNKGHLYTWGANGVGQLGNGENGTGTTDKAKDKKEPVRIGSETNWKAIAAGNFHSMGLKSDGRLYAWGLNNSGQLGDGTNAQSNTPQQVGANTDWKAIAVGSSYSLALRSNGRLYAWGLNSSGQLGDGTTGNQSRPQPIGTDTWKAIAAGGAHSIAIKSDGSIYAWGFNGSGQLGIGGTDNQNRPQQIGTDTNWQAIAAGGRHSISIKADQLYTWGSNEFSQLGDNKRPPIINRELYDQNNPQLIKSLRSVKAVTSGENFSLAITDNSELYIWGIIGGYKVPTKVTSDTNWKDVAGGKDHVLALKSDGRLYSWGANSNGQLGDGTTVNKSRPTLIPVPR